MISPMYPSVKDPVYGTFIKIYFDLFCRYNSGTTNLICIRGRSYSLGTKVIKYLVFYSQIFYHLLFKKYDVIYVQTITTTIPPIKLVSVIKKINLVFNVHGSDVITVSRKTEFLKRLSIPLLYKAQLIVVPSDYFKSVVLNMFPKLKSGKVFVSPSGGVDVCCFCPCPNRSKIMTLGYVSRIDKGKGWDDFVELIAKLIRKGYKVKGIIAGRGADEGNLLQMIQSKEVSNNIDYIGPVAHDKLPKLFNMFDLFIFPTRRREGLGLVGIEALSCGVPVIGSNIGGVPGYIKNGENGFLFETGDIEDMYNKTILYFNLNSQEKDRMSRNARRTAEKYETNIVMKELYDRIVEFC